MTLVRITNDLLRFGLELAALAVLGVWGAHAAGGPGRWAVALGAPLAGAVFWGWWLAPKSAHRLDDPVRLVVEIAFFAVVAGALLALRNPVAGSAFLTLAVANALVLRLPALADHPWT